MTAVMTSAIERYLAAVNSLDRTAYLACFSPEAVVLDPYGGRPSQGQEGLNKFFNGMERTWASFTMTAGRSYVSGNRVAFAWSVRATAKSGKTADFEGINVLTVGEDGLVTQLEGYWDMGAMIAQIK